MSTETIYKLEPHRTMHLLGVDRYGAAGSYWGTSATGFSLSGVFRDMADFVVLMLWDADDYFGHYQTTRYLPDFSFTGMVLTFDLQASGAQQLDSVMNQWIPWRSLSYILSDGQPETIDMAAHTTKVGGTQSTASANVTVSGTPQLWDKVTLWYQNIAFEYTVQPTPSTAVASVTCSYYNAGGTGTVHSLTINGHTYSYIQLATDSSAQCAEGVYLAAMGNTSVSLTWIGYQVTVNPAVTNTSISVQASDGTNCYIWRDSITNIASTIAGYINAFNWSVYSLPLTATASGATITVSCGVPGADGNPTA